MRKMIGKECIKNLDYSKSEDLQLIFTLYGGEEFLKKECANLYQKMIEMSNKHKKGLALDYQTMMQRPVDERGELQDCITGLININPEKRKVITEGFANFTGNIEYIIGDIYLYRNGELITHNQDSTCSNKYMIISAETALQEIHKEDIIEGLGVFTWQKDDNMYSQIHHIQKVHTNELYGYVETVKLIDPVSKTGKDTVVVCYDRTPSDGESVDYVYPYKLINNAQELILDVNLEIKLKDDVEYGSASVRDFYLLINSEKNGSAMYCVDDTFRDNYRKCFTWEGNTVNFSLTDNQWGVPIPLGRMDYANLMWIQGQIPFIVKGRDNPNLSGDIQIILNHGTSEKPEEINTPLMRLLWGCLAIDTMILMGDGSHKKIQDIKIGERVNCGEGKIGMVINTWTGVENEELVCIEMSNEKYLKCTKSHPIMTNKGYLEACKLTEETTLISENNEEIKIIAMYPIREETVYNLDIEVDGDEGCFFAEDVKVGDNMIQNRMFSIKDQQNKAITKIQEEVLKFYSM